MYVATLDILTEKGGFNPQAARAIGEAIDLEIARSRDISPTREDVAECRRALGEEIGSLRGETHTMKADLVRCVFIVIMGQTATLLGVVYFFMKYFK
jgi:hypothetical protein